jgi:rare lipoprotein A
MTKSKATRTSRASSTLGLWAVLAILASAAAAQGGWKAEGIASWYGPGFDGRKTANGEIFDSSKWTAAHRSLPFGTLVLLSNAANGRRCVVRINDRGPFVEGRLMDLSRAAAEYLGFAMAGVARLSMEEVRGVEPGL